MFLHELRVVGNTYMHICVQPPRAFVPVVNRREDKKKRRSVQRRGKRLGSTVVTTY